MNSDKRVPARWPKDLKYLRNMEYSTSIPPNVLVIIRGAHKPTSAASAGFSAPVTIRRIDDKSHPAYGQMGLFVSKKIPPNSHILDYMGEVHSDDRPESDYDLSLYRSSDGSVSVGIDAARMGNEARFVNDYRGIAKKPNALFKEVKTTTGEMRMSVWSGSESIPKGKEMLVSYGKAWWQARQSSKDAVKSEPVLYDQERG